MGYNGRLNKVIDLLEHGQVVFSCGTIPNGNFDEIAALGQSDYDMIILQNRTRRLRLPHPAPLLAVPAQPPANASSTKAIYSRTWCRSSASRPTPASAMPG